MMMMMNISLLVVVLFVGTQAKAFPFGFNNNNPYPNNLDTPDDDQIAAAGRVGVAGQGITTVPVDGGDSSSSSSSSSSSEEDTGSVGVGGGGTGITAVPAGPIKGAGQAVGGQAGQGAEAAAGDSSNGHGHAIQAVGSPVQKTGGDSGNHAALVANPLSMKVQQSVRERQGRQSGAIIAVTVLGLVAGVTALSVAVYKYKGAISARYSRLAQSI